MRQAICECGRVAEVRNRKNGKKLAFLHCTACGGSVVSTARAAAIEERAADDIGVKGEFPNSATKTSDSSKVDFKPSPDDMPEVLEPESEILKTENDEKPRRSSNGFKWCVGLLLTGLLGGGVYVATKN